MLKVPEFYTKDHYACLQVSKRAGRAEIKRAYNRLLKPLGAREREAGAKGDKAAAEAATAAKNALNLAKNDLEKVAIAREQRVAGTLERPKVDLVTLWEECLYLPILEKYAQQGVTLDIREDWDVKAAFTELTERESIRILGQEPPARVSLPCISKYEVPPPSQASVRLDR